MAPKPKKDSLPSIQPEDCTQDVLVVVTVPTCRLQVGLLAAAELAAPEPLQDHAAAPAFHLELHCSSTPVPVVCGPLSLGSDFTLAPNVEHMFKFKKGPDVIDSIINARLDIRLCDSSSKAMLATAQVDLLPFGLGSSSIEDGAMPWQPAPNDKVFKVLPGSTLAVSIVLKHQPRPIPPVTAVPAPPSSASGSSASAQAAAAAAAAAAQAAAAAALQAALEPYAPLSAEEAAGCNILQLTALSAAPLPANWAAAAHAAAGGLTCTMQLHLPGAAAAGKPVMGPKCTGGCSSGAQLEWPKQQQSCRMHLSAATTAALKAHLELGQPLLLEVARYLSGPAADTATDPAFAAYHALLQFGCVAEQLQELGAVSAAGMAVPVGAMTWALQQGKLAAPGLPATAPPASARPKPIEEAPAAPTEGQLPACAWAAAGTRFTVALRLVRPLWEPWEPPAQPGRQLADLFPPHPPPAAPPARTAADRLREKIQEIAKELAGKYAQQLDTTNSSSSSLTAASMHQQLVYELNRSGSYLEIKQQLRPLLVGLVAERYSSSGGAGAVAGCRGGASLGPAEVQQLHHDLYGSLVQELHAALAELAAQTAAEQQQQQQQQQGLGRPSGQHSQEHHNEQVVEAGQDQQQQQRDEQQAAEGRRLLQLAAECELQGDDARSHELHTRRIAVLPTAEAWFDYGCFCIRSGAHAKAHTALGEALALQQDHAGAALALLSLCLAGVVGCDSPDGPPDPAALESAEVLGHSLKGRQGADVLPWALLALLYRSQGKEKEVSARSCHQEVLRQCKAAWAAAAAAQQTSSSSSQPAAETVGSSSTTSDPTNAAAASSLGAAEQAAVTAGAGVGCVSGVVMPGANGYLAAAELVLQLNLPGLAAKLLELAAGLKDPEGLLSRRLKLAQVAAAVAAGSAEEALTLLRQLAEGLGPDASDEEKGGMQLLLGGVTYKGGNLALAKQHYRRALQKVPQGFTTCTYLQLGHCFMASGDARAAADTYTTCISVATSAAAAAAHTTPATATAPTATAPGDAAGWPATASWWGQSGSGTATAVSVSVLAPCVAERLVPGCCASVWLALALAYTRLGDSRAAELALSEANLCDSEHPGVWGHLALLALQQGREDAAGQALRQAQRCGLSSPELLVGLGDAFTSLGRYDSAADCLARAAAARDHVKVRCKLAAVLLSQHDYDGCRRQLSAAARLPADESDAALLEEVVRKLQVNWPML